MWQTIIRTNNILFPDGLIKLPFAAIFLQILSPILQYSRSITARGQWKFKKCMLNYFCW